MLSLSKRDVTSASLDETPKEASWTPRSTNDVYVDERVRDAARRLFEAAGAVAVILFGSRARGTAHHWSDWDLCVVLPDDAPTEDLTPFRLRPLTSDIGVPIDVVTIRRSVYKDCMEKCGSLSQEVARDGKVILGDLETS